MSSFIHSNVKYTMFRMFVKTKPLLIYTSTITEKNAKAKNSILASIHYQTFNHNFQQDAKLTLIKKNNEANSSRQLQPILKKQETLLNYKAKNTSFIRS